MEYFGIILDFNIRIGLKIEKYFVLMEFGKKIFFELKKIDLMFVYKILMIYLLYLIDEKFIGWGFKLVENDIGLVIKYW